jgi:hypothetical protein
MKTDEQEDQNENNKKHPCEHKNEYGGTTRAQNENTRSRSTHEEHETEKK